MIWTNLSTLVEFAKRRAQRWTYDGKVSSYSSHMLDLCTHRYQLTPDTGAILIYSRDTGHHTSGWWKNPDYERCLHLSISYRAAPGRGGGIERHIAQDHQQSRIFCEAFFNHDKRNLWAEPPYSPEGTSSEVWHYRLFCDPSWAPILPRGEVYSRELTEAGWRSFSDLHGYTPDRQDAPFLLEGR